MDDKKMEMVSYVVYESCQTRSDRIIHRLIVALLVSLVLLFISNVLWMVAYTHNGTEVVNGDGVTNVVGENGEIYGNDNHS